MRSLKCTTFALFVVFACTLASASTLGEEFVPEDSSSLLSRNVREETVATSVDAGDLAVEVGDPVRADLDESSVAFVSNGDDSKIVDGAVRDAADETDAFDVVVFDAVDTFANVPRRAGPFFMDDDWDDDLVAVSQYSYVSSYDNEPYVSFPVRSTAWMDADETWCLLCQNFFANLTFALMISVFVVAGIYYLLIEDDNEDDDDDHHACRCCKKSGAIVIDVAVLDELRAAAAQHDAKTCGDEPIKCETKDTKKM